MPADDLFESSIRSSGDLAGVFEYDGDTGYFYLCATDSSSGNRVLDAIHIVSGSLDFGQDDISVRWDRNEQRAGLFIRGTLWAVFDSMDRSKLGGDYRASTGSQVSAEVASHFERSV